jgi:hypothetical protein
MRVFVDEEPKRYTEDEIREGLDKQGYVKWDMQTNSFYAIPASRREELLKDAERKRQQLQKSERPLQLERLVAAVAVVYGLPVDDIPRRTLKSEKLNDARDHICWVARALDIEDIHLRRLFGVHHTTVRNWRQRFRPIMSAPEIRRVEALLVGGLDDPGVTVLSKRSTTGETP